MVWSKSYVIAPTLNEEAETLGAIRWDVFDAYGGQTVQHLGKWLVSKRGPWSVILSAYRKKTKHFQWGAPTFSLTRWRKVRGVHEKNAQINLSPKDMPLLGTGGLMDEVLEHVLAHVEELGTDALEDAVLSTPGDDWD